MRFVNINGVLQKARRFISYGAGSIQEQDVKNPDKLSEILRKMSQRLSDVEAAVPPEAIEFEVNVGIGGALTGIAHSFNGPVRWYVVAWIQAGTVAYPVAAPALVQDATSTPKQLVLRSYVAGKAIVRVEPAFADIDPGITTVAAPDQVRLALGSDFTTTSQTIVTCRLGFTAGPNETWRIHMEGMCEDSAIGGMKFGVIAPTGATVEAMHYSTSTGLTVRTYELLTVINSLAGAQHTAAATRGDDQIIGVVKTGATGGTIAIGVATVNFASTAKVYAKSSLVADKVTEV